MVGKQVLQQLETNLGLELSLEHAVEDVIEDGEHRRHLLVTVLILFAEYVVHVVEVKSQELILARRLVWRHVDDRFKVEDLSEDSALSLIGPSFLQALRLILVQFRIQEELLFGVCQSG